MTSLSVLLVASVTLLAIQGPGSNGCGWRRSGSGSNSPLRSKGDADGWTRTNGRQYVDRYDPESTKYPEERYRYNPSQESSLENQHQRRLPRRRGSRRSAVEEIPSRSQRRTRDRNDSDRALDRISPDRTYNIDDEYDAGRRKSSRHEPASSDRASPRRTSGSRYPINNNNRETYHTDDEYDEDEGQDRISSRSNGRETGSSDRGSPGRTSRDRASVKRSTKEIYEDDNQYDDYEGSRKSKLNEGETASSTKKQDGHVSDRDEVASKQDKKLSVTEVDKRTPTEINGVTVPREDEFD